MGKETQNIKENLEKVINWAVPAPLGAELCQVTAINILDYTITCVGQATSKVYFNVPLVTTISEKQSITAIPKLDSKVIIVQIDRLNSFVALTGELTSLYFTAPEIIAKINDKFQITDVSNVNFEITPSGMKLVVGSQSLKSAIQDLQTAIENLTVMTSTGASSVPINIANITTAFTKIKNTLQ